MKRYLVPALLILFSINTYAYSVGDQIRLVCLPDTQHLSTQAAVFGLFKVVSVDPEAENSRLQSIGNVTIQLNDISKGTSRILRIPQMTAFPDISSESQPISSAVGILAWDLATQTQINSGFSGGGSVQVAGTYYDISSCLPQAKANCLAKGDTNLSGSIDFADLVTLSQNYGKSNVTPLQGDLNNDGVVDFQDLITLSQNMNKPCN